MSGKPEDAAKRDVAALAAELAEQISALAAFSGSGLAPTKAPAARSGPSPGVPVYAGPRTTLEYAGRFVSPVLPSGAPLRPLKAALLRILRIVTRDQTTFNSALLESLRGALLETEAGLRDLAAASQRAEEFVREATARLDEAVADFSGRLARESKARESAGRDLLASQRRLDGLEKDRDERVEAAARVREREAETRLEEERQREDFREGLRLLRLEWSSLRSNLQNLSEARAPVGTAPRAEASSAVRPDDPLRAGLYVDFEEHFRGSEDEIRRRQKTDAALFRGAPGPVADLGCGRGEFLEALAAEGIAGIGCDANPIMAARAKEKGLAVDSADLFSWLAAKADGSLGGITAFQVIEHLPPAHVFDLVELASAKLAAGGILLLETVNPESVYAMRWFWMDLTHVRPVPAPSLARLVSACGFRDVRIDWRSPVPAAEAPPAALASDPTLGPVVRLLFGSQEYAIISRR